MFTFYSFLCFVTLDLLLSSCSETNPAPFFVHIVSAVSNFKHLLTLYAQTHHSEFLVMRLRTLHKVHGNVLVRLCIELCFILASENIFQVLFVCFFQIRLYVLQYEGCLIPDVL